MSRVSDSPGYRAGWCIHYRHNRDKSKGDTCEAGVHYASLGRPWPCFLEKETLKPKAGAAHCSELRTPTRDEVSAHDKWQKARLDKTFVVLNGILPWRKKNKGRSISEVVECPSCKGRLHLSMSGYNGHVHGRCETQSCVSWME